MTRSTQSLLLLCTILLGGCSSEIDGKSAAEVTDVPAVQAGSAQPAAAQPAAAQPAADGSSLAFSNDGSTLAFVGAKITRDHTGGFDSFSGTVQVAGDQVTGATVDIDLASVFTDSKRLTSHLESDDFFDVQKYARATFATTAITAGAEGGTHTVTGVLDFHGIEKALSFPATISVADGSGTVKAEFTINRKDWGLTYRGKPDDLIKEDVLIKLDLKLAPKAG